jgi:hypothetical protein
MCLRERKGGLSLSTFFLFSSRSGIEFRDRVRTALRYYCIGMYMYTDHRACLYSYCYCRNKERERGGDYEPFAMNKEKNKISV